MRRPTPTDSLRPPASVRFPAFPPRTHHIQILNPSTRSQSMMCYAIDLYSILPKNASHFVQAVRRGGIWSELAKQMPGHIGTSILESDITSDTPGTRLPQNRARRFPGTKCVRANLMRSVASANMRRRTGKPMASLSVDPVQRHISCLPMRGHPCSLRAQNKTLTGENLVRTRAQVRINSQWTLCRLECSVMPVRGKPGHSLGTTLGTKDLAIT